ncbi:apolipoprotein N-acyltransferase [Calothrix sp. FACHB-1219]|uniref:apolipoprotein N-acyltransferase n=1 Tax=unclassified Calothrix TaxID=2619626 RepID=UPI0016882976|nr:MULTISPECIES: apolipoprotein N-acyltransferase [unclassified Calothrix]MBD2207342.1 apolipoprotein N-acyltransferase [Calothrix sp. FACHB-168]MBD2221963.1 apolipoprotein N-acyltransferase [Calothrix sp. FACHB-1219]
MKNYYSVFRLLPSNFYLPMVSGILMGLSIVPVGAWPLAWIALAPLWVLVITRAKQKKPLTLFSRNGEPKRQERTSFVFHPSVWWGIGYHGLALSWITGIHPMTWMGVNWWASLAIALFCWLFITFWGTALVVIWAVGMTFLCSLLIPPNSQFPNSPIPTCYRVLIGVALWCSLEAIWSTGPLWWTSLSFTQSPYNLAILHLGQLSGPSTVTAALVAVNGLMAEAWINRGKNTIHHISTSLNSIHLNLSYLNLATGLLVGLHLLGFGLYSHPLREQPEAALKVGIIQGNIPNNIKLFSEGKRRALERYTNGYQTLANQRVQAVLTPEGALPFFLNELKRKSFYLAILDKGIVTWVGAYGERRRAYTNSLFTIIGTGETFSRYDKVKLVPLGEYIPFEQLLGSIVNRLSPLKANLVAGEPNQLFETPFGRAIVGICYESAFAQHFQRQAAAGGQFILTASNNAHYSKAMPAQHHAQDVMRAIETDRWAVRATNTGYSGIVNPHGRTLWISRINTYDVHIHTVYRQHTQTLYVRWGDWLTPMLLMSVITGISIRYVNLDDWLSK